MPCNTHDISEFETPVLDTFVPGCKKGSIGAGLYPCLALLNHSCEPSFMRCNKGKFLSCLHFVFPPFSSIYKMTTLLVFGMMWTSGLCIYYLFSINIYKFQINFEKKSEKKKLYRVSICWIC